MSHIHFVGLTLCDCDTVTVTSVIVKCETVTVTDETVTDETVTVNILRV